VAVATVVNVALGLERLSDADIVLVYMAAVMLAAVRWGRAVSVAAAVSSVVAYDFFFVRPFYTFSVDDPRNLFTFAMLFATGIFISTLALRLQHAERQRKNEETKSALLSSVSHDLRTPLATITGAATALRDESAPLPDEERHALLDSIVDEAASLERLGNPGGSMNVFLERFFGFLSRNAVNADRWFRIPHAQVIEVGAQIDL
jgi:two-component system sensor histidine kinase KdpD